jgi:hypothetical protein
MRFLTLLLSLHLFAVSLLPGADVHELHDLPTLLAHRQAAHAASGFWAFFYDHYIGDHKDTDGAHKALPYHHVHVCAAQVADMPTPPFVWEPAALAPLEAADWGAVMRPGAPIAVARAWWQPPQA